LARPGLGPPRWPPPGRVRRAGAVRRRRLTAGLATCPPPTVEPGLVGAGAVRRRRLTAGLATCPPPTVEPGLVGAGAVRRRRLTAGLATCPPPITRRPPVTPQSHDDDDPPRSTRYAGPRPSSWWSLWDIKPVNPTRRTFLDQIPYLRDLSTDPGTPERH